MTLSIESLQLLFFLLLLLALIIGLGAYMTRVFRGERTWLHPILGPLENSLYRLSGIKSSEEMGWRSYLKALLLFNLLGFVLIFALLLLQPWLPLNSEGFGPVPLPLAFNTAASFATNTNWQPVATETFMSYGTRMLGLTVQNFLSAATGLAALMTLIRALAGTKPGSTLGNFWVDLVRGVVYLLLPLSLILSLLLVSQGVIQNFSPYTGVQTLEGEQQLIALGPAASQVAIKQIGTNGGGFFGANSAHPFENPTGFSNLLELLAILAIPAALTYTYGKWTGFKKHGWLIFGAMFFIFAASTALALYSETRKSPPLYLSPLMEGKEVRFGVVQSVLWSTATTATASGSVNASLDSLSPLAGGAALFNMLLGEVAFGGVGVGLASMIMFILLALFLSGLMVGRTPEYMGKKIEKREVQWMVLAILGPPLLILAGSALFLAIPKLSASIGNAGPHGLTEMLYAFTSSAANNGSSFAALNAATPAYNIALGSVMILARLMILVPTVAIAGELVKKRSCPPSTGVFSTSTFLFLLLLLLIVLIVGALTFFPALSLGPVLEHLLQLKGVLQG